MASIDLRWSWHQCKKFHALGICVEIRNDIVNLLWFCSKIFIKMFKISKYVVLLRQSRCKRIWIKAAKQRTISQYCKSVSIFVGKHVSDLQTRNNGWIRIYVDFTLKWKPLHSLVFSEFTQFSLYWFKVGDKCMLVSRWSVESWRDNSTNGLAVG